MLWAWLPSGDIWPTRAGWLRILGSGLLWFGLNMITLNWGERDVDSGAAAILVKIGPILLARLGGWLLHGGSRVGWPPGWACRSVMPYLTALCSQ
jgi:drug/metabolite transporter (DMT)-like permease